MDAIPAVLAFLADAWGATRSFISAVREELGLWGFLFAFVAVFLIWVRPAVQLLARTVYLPLSLPWHGRVSGFLLWTPLRYLWASATVLNFLFRYGLRPTSLYNAARYRVEAELLNPRPERPHRFHLDNARVYRNELNSYKEETQKWNETIRDCLSDLMREGKDGARIVVDTCFNIHSAQDDIQRYFKVLASSKGIAGDKTDRFLSRVKVKSGFVAPLYLLGGLLVRFDSEWEPVLREYGRALSRRNDPLRRQGLRSLQTFLFDCWLLWGPSIPLCNCSQWQGRRLVQFGYGDESNSIALTRGETSLPDTTLLEAEGGGFAVLATQTSVTGVLKWGPEMKEADEYCPAQRAVFAPGAGRIVLECAEDVVLRGGTTEDVAQTYYSAYLWMMFLICDGEDRPLIAAEPWRNLLPFFEHANIAEADTYLVLKRQLAFKALSSIEEILAKNPDTRLHYVCAIDDSMCSPHQTMRIKYPPPRGQSIRELMTSMLGLEQFKRVAESGRLVIHETAWLGGMFSACHLPGVIEQYFRAIPQEQDDVAMDFRELTDSSDDLALLRRFYDSLYVTEFPDADERESYENMARYLRLKREGWYKRNNYHIVVAMRGVEPIGGAIVDFLEQPAAGVIEFLFVARKERQTGIGRALLEHTERLLEEDARERANRGLACIVGEMNDPFLPARVGDNIDPWARTLIWEKWGYRGFDFRYLQPALSGAQLPVTNLMLIGKILRSDWREAVPAQDLKLIVREYFRWAMRIEEPEKTCIEYREMAAYLDVRGEVPTLSLGAYVGNDTARPIYRTEVRGEFHPDFGPAMSLYRGTFGTGALTVDEADFRRAIASSGGDARYHLWALRHLEGGAVEGLASFFALPSAGFGGYIALSGKLQGAGCLPLVVARIEEQMLRDRPAARGWYIEVGPATDPAPFLRLGFREIAVDYAQPALGPGRDSVRVRFLFKPFGRCYGLTPLPPADLLTALEEILRVVYGIMDARAHASYLTVARAIDSLAGSVPFR